MELNVPVEQLRKHSIMLAAPMYGGQCSGLFARSIANLTATCQNHGIPLSFYFLFNESLITRARNYCVDEFLRSECTHLMFIDSDIGFDANDVLALLAMSISNDGDNEYDVLCGPYPKKTIAWEKIVQAVNAGFAKDNPNELENFVGDYVFNPKKETESIKIGEPCEVREGGTGFMMIRRNTFAKYKEAFPKLSYKPDHVRTEHFDGTTEIMAYFDCIIDPETKRYLSEDYMFCYNVQKIGLKVWMCPWMHLKHVGSYIFGGSLGHLAAAGAAPTADPAIVAKKKAQ